VDRWGEGHAFKGIASGRLKAGGASRLVVHMDAFRLRASEFISKSGACAKPVDNEVDSTPNRYRIQRSNERRASSADCGISD
jgi:hypothetical protein